jgi:hypothetical protein
LPITWNDYLGLKRTNNKDYISSHGIETYADLVSRIDKKDVIPPAREEVQAFFPKDSSLQDIRDEIREKEEMSKGGLYQWKTPGPPSQKKDISKRKPKRTRKRQKASSAKE